MSTHRNHHLSHQDIFEVAPSSFEALCLLVFDYQYNNNPIYQAYCQALGRNPENVKSLQRIPFLPIRFFKTHAVVSGVFEPEAVFESSGTTGSIPSRHAIKSLSLYEDSFLKCFQHFFGNTASLCIIGLLPSYLERGNSSLVYMTEQLIRLSGHPKSGFYLYDFEKLSLLLKELEQLQQPTLLLGVSYALLDFSNQFPIPLQHTIVMETGGMKGRQKELSRTELHEQLKKNFQTDAICSEYGMTELLSQAYSKGKGIFKCPSWMRVVLRPEDDPLGCIDADASMQTPQTGAINIIDLANLHSCSFIATEDLGILHADGSFEVVGRMQDSDIRGCGLMILPDAG